MSPSTATTGARAGAGERGPQGQPRGPVQEQSRGRPGAGSPRRAPEVREHSGAVTHGSPCPAAGAGTSAGESTASRHRVCTQHADPRRPCHGPPRLHLDPAHPPRVSDVGQRREGLEQVGTRSCASRLRERAASATAGVPPGVHSDHGLLRAGTRFATRSVPPGAGHRAELAARAEDE